MQRRILLLCLAAGLGLVGSATALEPGDVVISDDSGSVFGVDPASGDRSVLSGCSDRFCGSLLGSGPAFGRPSGIAVEADGMLVVADRQLEVVFRVDPENGDRRVLSGPGAGTGPALQLPEAVVVEPGGSLLVASRQALLRLDRDTGDRMTLASDAVGDGPALGVPFDLDLEPDGSILLADTLWDAVLRVDPNSGDRVYVSVCASPSCAIQVGDGPALVQTWAIAREADGQILLVDHAADTLYDVDPLNGDRTPVAFNAIGGAGGAGPRFVGLSGIRVDAEGTPWLLDMDAQSLLVVDPATGDREIISRAGGFGSGPQFVVPRRLAIVPAPLEIELDVRPRSPANVVNPMGRGALRVALLGSESFDPADVDVASVALGSAGARVLRDDGLRDSDGDGIDDRLLRFEVSETGLLAGETHLCVEGRTSTGAAFTGCDAIRSVAPGS
jgi:sugar lactone lactonase YvrE